CQRTKEFLSDQSIEFKLVDIDNDSGGRERFLKLGARGLPVLVKNLESADGDAAMLAGMQLVDLNKVASFLDRDTNSQRGPLSAQELLTKFVHNLRVAQSHFHQMPERELDVLATPKRGRPVRIVGVHIFTIAQAYLDCVVHGARDMAQLCTDYQKIKEGTF